MATTAESRGTRLEQLERAHAKRVEELEGTRAEIARLRIAEEEALQASVREKPTVRVFVLGSEASRLRERREKLERKIEPLEREVAAIGPLLAEEHARRAREEVDRRLIEAKTLRARELAGWERLGAVFEEFHSIWRDEIVEPVQALDRLFQEVDRSGVFQVAEDDELRLAFETATRPAVRPFPVTLGAVLERIFLVSTDMRRLGYRVLEHDGSALFLDSDRVLPRVTPDLRELPEPELSGRVDKVRAVDLR